MRCFVAALYTYEYSLKCFSLIQFHYFVCLKREYYFFFFFGTQIYLKSLLLNRMYGYKNKMHIFIKSRSINNKNLTCPFMRLLAAAAAAVLSCYLKQLKYPSRNVKNTDTMSSGRQTMLHAAFIFVAQRFKMIGISYNFITRSGASRQRCIRMCAFIFICAHKQINKNCIPFFENFDRF